MCPDKCFAELWMVSPVSLAFRLSRPLEPLRSDLRPSMPLDGSRALWFLLSSWPFRLRLPAEVPAFFSFAVSRLLFRRLGLAVLSFCVLWTFKDYRFPPGTFVLKILYDFLKTSVYFSAILTL
ncbi:hypothetical protein NPIL_219031 [Nephila pilipes]|uniref:Uncharacterized protein n=1 Tax=Nephila pilipes TaxID=299642 RepID=A0A8X6PI14_NEPPI|nr:hypothetical protein NPIL_219031 [Nephila pilipes]